MSSFACPNCNKVLKTSAPMPAGKSVKCPGCGQVFSVPETLDETKGKAVPSSLAGSPRANSGGSRRAASSADEDDDERRSRSRQKSGNNKGFVLALIGAGVLVLILAMGGFVWPGFLVDRGGNVAPVDLYALLPNNCDIVFGANNPGQVKLFDKLIKKSNDAPPEAIDLFNRAERIVGGSVGDGEVHVLAMTSTTPLDSEKVRRAFNAGPAITVQGKVLYKVVNTKTGSTEYLAMPNNRTVVVGALPETPFVQLLEAKGKLASPELLAHIGSVNQRSLWAVGNLQGSQKAQLQKLDALAAVMPESADIVTAVKRAKTVALTFEAPKDALLQIELDCLTEADAEKTETQGRLLWEQKAKPFVPLVSLMLGGNPGVKGIGMMANDVANSLKIQRQGTKVTVAATIMETTLTELENRPPEMPRPGGGENPLPPKKAKN